MVKGEIFRSNILEYNQKENKVICKVRIVELDREVSVHINFPAFIKLRLEVHSEIVIYQRLDNKGISKGYNIDYEKTFDLYGIEYKEYGQ